MCRDQHVKGVKQLDLLRHSCCFVSCHHLDWYCSVLLGKGCDIRPIQSVSAKYSVFEQWASTWLVPMTSGRFRNRRRDFVADLWKILILWIRMCVCVCLRVSVCVYIYVIVYVSMCVCMNVSIYLFTNDECIRKYGCVFMCWVSLSTS